MRKSNIRLRVGKLMHEKFKPQRLPVKYTNKIVWTMTIKLEDGFKYLIAIYVPDVAKLIQE